MCCDYAWQALGLVENQSDWYLGKLWRNHKPWPALVSLLLSLTLYFLSCSFDICRVTEIELVYFWCTIFLLGP